MIGYHVAVLKIKANCHAWDLWTLSYLLGLPDLRYLPGTDLLFRFKAPREQSLVNIVWFQI